MTLQFSKIQIHLHFPYHHTCVWAKVGLLVLRQKWRQRPAKGGVRLEPYWPCRCCQLSQMPLGKEWSKRPVGFKIVHLFTVEKPEGMSKDGQSPSRIYTPHPLLFQRDRFPAQSNAWFVTLFLAVIRARKSAIIWEKITKTGQNVAFWIKTLPNAQRTRGLSSSYQSNFLRSYKHKSTAHPPIIGLLGHSTDSVVKQRCCLRRVLITKLRLGSVALLP